MLIETRPLWRLEGALASPAGRTAAFTLAVAGTAAVAVVTSDAAPTAVPVVDEAWRGGLVALVAYFAGTARRWTWFLPSGAAAVLAADQVALVGPALGVALGMWSVVTDTRTRARGALVAGIGCVVLLRADPVGFHGLTAILTGLAVVPVVLSGYAHAGRRVRRRARRALAGSLVAVVLALAGAALAAASVGTDLTRGARAVDQGVAAARNADDELAAEQLTAGAQHLSSADNTLSGWFAQPARLLPVVGPNLDAVGSLAQEAGDVAEVMSSAAGRADVDRLRFVDGRLDPLAIAALEEPLEQSVDALESLEERVESVSQSPWLAAPLADRFEGLRAEIDGVLPEARTALDGVRLGPDLLGGSEPRRYLVLFVTPVEARGRSGFPGNFAELQLDNGKLTMPRFGRISELEQGGLPGDQRQLAGPPEYVSRYARFDPATTWRNLTMSPDFPSVAQAVRELYPQSGGREIHGVMAVDPIGLQALMRYTGSVQVEGLAQQLTEDNAAQFLLLDQYVEFTDVSARVDVLEHVARTTFERLTEADLPSPRAMTEHLDPIVDGGHIQVANFDDRELLMFTAWGLTGDLGPVRGDFLGVTSSNAGGSKIDVFLERQLAYDVRWDADTGDVTGTITARLTNAAPSDGLPGYVIGNALDLPFGTNRSFVSVYTPHRLVEARIDGEPSALQPEEELERKVYSTFVTIPPGGSVTIELDVEGRVDGDYVLDVVQQPLVRPEQADVAVSVDGGGDLDVDGTPGVDVEGDVARWSGPLETPVELSLTPR